MATETNTMSTTIPDDGEIKFGREMTRHKTTLVVSVITGLLSAAGSLTVPLVIRQVITDVATGRSISWLVVGAFLIAVAAAVAQGGSAYLLGRIGSWMTYRVRVLVMRHVLRLPVQRIKAEGSGPLVSRITADALIMRQVIDVGLAQVPASILLVVASLAAMLWLSWLLTLVAGAVFALLGVVIAVFFRKIKANALEQQISLGDLAGSFTAQLEAITTVKACRAEDLVLEDLAGEADRARRIGFTGDVLQASLLPLLAGGQQIALVAVILVGSQRMAHGELSVASFSAFLLYLLQLATPVVMVFTGIGRLRIGQAVKDRFNALLAEPREGAANAQDAVRPAAAAAGPDAEADAVVFSDVSFTYASAAAPSVERVSMRVPRRGLTTLVGPSGAGKSTALALLERFVEPDSGRIDVLGTDSRSWSLRDLRASIGYVDQAFTLLKASVRRNLCIQRGEQVPDEELWRALDSVGLAEQVRALPQGLDTEIGAAADLSGGQRQRLALARVLLSDAELVVLDEPTSQLDGLNEDRFRTVIEGLARDHAVLVVAHRLSTVRSAQHVILLGRGGVVDEGPHEQLMQRCPEYRELHEAQSLVSSAASGLVSVR
jgi:ATP-binding cassette subfamily B protein